MLTYYVSSVSRGSRVSFLTQRRKGRRVFCYQRDYTDYTDFGQEDFMIGRYGRTASSLKRVFNWDILIDWRTHEPYVRTSQVGLPQGICFIREIMLIIIYTYHADLIDQEQKHAYSICISKLQFIYLIFIMLFRFTSTLLKWQTKKEVPQNLEEPLWKVAATYSPARRSTIGADGLNFSVRNGKRWNPDAITTGNKFRHILQ